MPAIIRVRRAFLKSAVLRPFAAMIVCTVMWCTLAGAAGFEAGAAKRSIVPPHPTKMGGFFDRDQTFEGVDTTVYARALVLRNGGTTIAVLAADLVAVSRGLVEGARGKVATQLGIPEANVLISATHDHSAPSGFTGSLLFGQAEDVALSEFLIDTFAATIAEAHAALRPARLGFAYGRLDSITRNRQQDNNDVIDPDVGVLKVQAADSRETIGILCNFTGHPVILGSDNLKLSSEYPGQACATIEEVLGGVAVFTQGACGDITMHRSGPPFDEVKRLGRIVAGEVIKTAEQVQTESDPALFATFEVLNLDARVVPSPETAGAAAAAKKAALDHAVSSGAQERERKRLERDFSSAQTTLMVARVIADNPEALAAVQQGSVHVLQLGPLVAVGIPGELFVEYALEMKQRVRQDTGRPMILVGYANDYLGYIVTPRAVHTGGYEQAVSRLAPSAGRDLTEAAMGIVSRSITPLGE